MHINIPELSLVLLVGTSGSGKSTFAKKHFGPYEVVSSDECRGLVSNDVNSLKATNDAFELLEYIVSKRLKNGLLTVIDATNVQPASRKRLVRLAKAYHTLPVAIVLNLPREVCEIRNQYREDRKLGKHVIRKQYGELKRSLKGLRREGFKKVYVLSSEDEVDAVVGITREKLYNDKREEHGPFDIIGDVHGCYDELVELLVKLGYQIEAVADDGQNFGLHIRHPEGRRAVFVGDLVDRGPASPAVLRLVMSMVQQGTAYCVPGNHDVKLQKKLSGRDVKVAHGLAETLRQLEQETPEFREAVREFLYSLISHYVFDEGKLVVAHAGLTEEMQGRGSAQVRAFCLYGETTGEIDEYGLPVRYNWASEYRGRAKVVYGHTPVPAAEWLNRTIDIDTGCVFGGKLTALRYPEEELVSVPAKQVYYEPAKPLIPEVETGLTHQQENDDLLHIEDVIGKRIVQTRLRNNLTISAEHSAAALEVMSRFAIHPKWLMYLPPTMSPGDTSELEGYLEHPNEALNYYRKQGIKQVICEEKHMGSRAILVLCKDASVSQARFGITSGKLGVCYTRTGRNFFKDSTLEQAFIERVVKALGTAQFWERFGTDWVCLDAELMPWSAKAQALLKEQYAAVGAAGTHALAAVEGAFRQMATRKVEGVAALQARFQQKYQAIGRFRESYRAYCWEVTQLEDYQLAPFHILATEMQVHTHQSHRWHMEEIHRICAADPRLLKATAYQIADLEDAESCAAAVQWWLRLTANGGEGMVVKPADFIAYGKKGLIQPAVKCRGKEYLRIIYGPDYDAPENLKRLRQRGLGSKRSLALREFALSVESLERFVRKEPLRRVHEAVFGVLALESEPVDPRL